MLSLVGFCSLRALFFGNVGLPDSLHRKSGSSSATFSEQELQVVNTFLAFSPNLLLVEPYHGLGNRLRAYASAAALARKSGRHLIVVWIPDVHVNARLGDLFEVKQHTVFDIPVLPTLERLNSDLLVYDYNSRGGKDKVLRDKSRSTIYARSAYILQSETKVYESDIRKELSKLRPVPQIQKRVVENVNKLTTESVIVGVHVRMQSNIQIDVPGIDLLPEGHPAGSSAMGPVKHSRDRCHYTAFIPHIKRILESNMNAKFLVATDDL